ncbi:tyrosine-type recombinase/integrase [Endozoicomonas sp. SESOKO1]|uniref:tyrosine-type recombinase/integrase n=1 Tax=Endozoicomonas sp. SESOKO1 TaxID=2828742 RepID=UPI00214943D0|nr:tyrosine-type recombinase/integrase [Endozoicomonas sp. SESOKO1]
MSDNKHLQLKRNVWFIHKRIPEHARHITGGSKFYVKSLGTSCIKTARIRRDMLLAEIHRKIEACEEDSDRANYLWRLSILQNDPNYEHAWERSQIIIDPDYSERFNEADIKAANTFMYGTQYPEFGYSLKDAAKPYKEFKAQTLKSVKDLGKIDLAVTSLLFSMGLKDTPLTSITRKQVKHWLSQLDAAGKTKKNYLSALRGIWNYAVDLEEIPEGNNPFDKHSISTKDTQSYQLFADHELSAIFADIMEQPKVERRLIPMMGLVTGCRIEELCQLRSEDVKDENGVPYISIREGKTKAATRLVPLHPWIAGEVLQQAEKTKGDYLFPALSTREDGKRSDAFSKWFGRVKKKHGVTSRDKAFHSLRVHTATAFERGNVPEETATFILGHERNMSMSYGLYSKGKTISQLYDAVLAASFPDCVVPVMSEAV